MFGECDEKIRSYQKTYEKKYNKKNNVKPFRKIYRKGSLVQICKHKSKKAKGGKTALKWYPRNSYYKIYAIDDERKTVILIDPKTKKILPVTSSFEYIRKFLKKK